MKILFVLCEGNHDAQFLRRLLLASESYYDPGWKISEYPKPLPSFIEKSFEQQDLSSIIIGKPNYPLAPSVSLLGNEGNDLVLVYTLGGQDQHENVRTLVQKIKTLVPQESDGLELYAGQGGDNKYSVLFFFDADHAGVEETHKNFIANYLDQFDGLQDIAVGEWMVQSPLSVGLFIFTDGECNTGTLEDTLIRLFHSSRGDLVDSARGLVDAHSDHREDTVAQVSKKNKSTLTVCGQAERRSAGSSLAVIVRDSAMLDNAFDFAETESLWSRVLYMIQGAFA